MNPETSNKAELLELLRDGLAGFHGSINALARRAGCSREWVRKVLKGLEKDEDLVLTASVLLLELQQAEAQKQTLAFQNIQQYLSLQF